MAAIKHGHTLHRKNSSTYQSWSMMRNRCNNEHARNYEWYGGRGIKICKRWDKFENFLADMGERPEGKTLDRIDNNKNYGPKNCKWSTHQEQCCNRRSTKFSVSKADAIRALYASGNYSQRTLGKMFGVMHSTIGYLVRNQKWSAQ